jgi:hypothetical protein
MSQEQPTSSGNPSKNVSRMPNKVDTIILLLVILTAINFWGHIQILPTEWEYLGSCSQDDSLERLGKDGWELVNIRREASQFSQSEYSYVYTFKRPKKFFSRKTHVNPNCTKFQDYHENKMR